MKQAFFLSLFFNVIWFTLPKSEAQQRVEKHDLATVSGWISGTFSSEAQFKSDTGFFNISLKMRPVWPGRKGENWFYLEQAMALALDKPYRQRVFQITQSGDSVLLSTFYELPNPSRFVGGCERPEVLDKISPDSLLLRRGCSIFIHKNSPEKYAGSTYGKLCHSSLKGASYSTSKVVVTKHEIDFWDQGWDAQDKQVWGAIKGPYQFVKQSHW